MIRCLIVEDYQSDSDKLLNFITAHNKPLMEVVATCDNAEDIFPLLKTHEPDVIFLDIELMSDLSGFEYLTILKNLKYQLPPVVITANTPPKASEVSKLQVLGKVVVLEKPYDEVDFREIIDALHPLSSKPPKPVENRVDNHFIPIIEEDREESHLKRMINLKDVLFVTAAGQKKIIQLNEGRPVFKWDSFALFTNYGFKAIHKTYVVNFKAPNTQFALDTENGRLVIRHGENEYRLWVNANFTTQVLLNYLNEV